MSKIEIRKKILKKRGELEEDYINIVSNKIKDYFLKNFSNFNSYLFYMDFKNEVKTFNLIKTLYSQGKQIFLPIVKNKDLLEIGKYVNKNVLIKNKFGILEPALKTNVNKLDVAVLPAVAFDKKCNRLGFGAGYYDKLMNAITVATSIGLAYEFQIVDELPSETHDIPVDFVITERNLYRREKK
jgi:5-formyltetrahydrofolate cyclo-ligase